MSTPVPEHIVAATNAALARISPTAGDEGTTDLADRVARLEAPVGPADQTAFHDFRHLEFAFESVWTELYDDEFVKDVASLHTTLGRVRTYAGYDADDPELTTWVEDLDQQLTDIEAEAEEAEQIADPSYDVVVAVFPTMSPSLWSWIGPEQRARFFNFALEYRSRSTGFSDDAGVFEDVFGEAGGFIDDAVDWAGDAVDDIADALFGWI